MQKRRRPSTNKFKERHPREVGVFYYISDKSGGHPARVYKCIPEIDTYYIQRFSTKPRRDRVKLSHHIDPEKDALGEKSWLIKKPEAVSFDDIRYNEKYNSFTIHPDDEELIKKYQRDDLIKKR